MVFHGPYDHHKRVVFELYGHLNFAFRRVFQAFVASANEDLLGPLKEHFEQLT